MSARARFGATLVGACLATVAAVAGAAGAAAATGPAQPQSWSPPDQVTPGETGAPGLRVERGYAPTPLGQVHYQDVGTAAPGTPVIVLLHQVPWFYVYYSRAQAELAARGFRSIAIDTPGYGLSARLDKEPTIADYAGAIDAAMKHLKLEKAVFVGHHTGSTIGAELARSRPALVQCVAMHGVPLYTPAEAKTRLDAPHWDKSYKPDGSHLTDRWMYLDGRIAGSLDSKHWSVVSLFLAGEKEWYGHHAVFKYDMAGALKAIKVPVVVVSNEADLLDYTFERTRALRPDFIYRHLDGKSSNMAFDEPKAWVDGVLDGFGAACGVKAPR